MIQAKYIETKNSVVVSWSGITANEPCEVHRTRAQPILVAVQAEGTWGNASAELLGSLSNAAFERASNLKQEPISFSDNAAAGVAEPYLYWQPTVSGNVETDITITLAYWIPK